MIFNRHSSLVKDYEQGECENREIAYLSVATERFEIVAFLEVLDSFSQMLI